MASGRKNYFRHSFGARNDIKLLMLRDEIGVGFYFFFFSLLELCGEESADDLVDNYVFHDATIRKLWGVNLKKSERIATQMNAVGLLEFKKQDKSFSFAIPNFSKYMGRYSNKTQTKTPNKVKESKVKERKETAKTKAGKLKFDFEALYKNYPIKKGKSKGIERCVKVIKTKQDYENLKKAISNYAQDQKDTDSKYIKHFSSFMSVWQDFIDFEPEISAESAFVASVRKAQAENADEGLDLDHWFTSEE